MLQFKELLGIDKSGRSMVLMTDNYVYCFNGTVCSGWLCSLSVWTRTIKEIIS